MRSSQEPVRILLVDDNPGDLRLMRETWSNNARISELLTAGGGDEAMHQLNRGLRTSPPTLPSLILLDLNMPGLDGIDVLRRLKNSPDFKHIPVIVLTSSLCKWDVHNAYAQQASCYLQKPADLDELEDTLKAIEQFWLRRVHLPKG